MQVLCHPIAAWLVLHFQLAVSGPDDPHAHQLLVLPLLFILAILISRWDFPHTSVGKESACHAGDQVQFLGQEGSPGEGNDNPLQSSCLENSMDRGACRLQSMGLQESCIQPSD